VHEPQLLPGITPVHLNEDSLTETATHEDPLPEHQFHTATHEYLHLVEAMLLKKEQAKQELVNKEKKCVNIFFMYL
jgi:hypothetical protein